ncbi:MAG: hypothetical protein LQ342_003715 [Letrouitia transgressa]|nr:MAG: hypothetical protein LQ342_003715 [Letrouitia transgressa]
MVQGKSGWVERHIWDTQLSNLSNMAKGLAIGGKGWPLYQLRRGCTGDRLSQCHLRPANPIATIDGHMAVTNGAKAKAWSFSVHSLQASAASHTRQSFSLATT